MYESLLGRVRRMISASIEDAVDAMERAKGTSVMREAIREVDRAIDEVRGEQETATARRLQAMRQQRMFRGQLAVLQEKARFAIAQDRDDLAEAALSRQSDFEMQAERLDTVQAEAASEAGRLDICLAALTTRKAQMMEALAAFESAQRDASLGGDGFAHSDRRTERRVERAEEAFDRAMAASGSVANTVRADAQVVAKVAEIDALQNSAEIARRMAALRSFPKAS